MWAMGRILDLLPELYRQEQNELVGFLEQLEPEIVDLEGKIQAITSLIDVDRCPEEYLPYLASLTNAPLIGDNPRLWRRQIRNWPWLLRLKGTEKSLALFLNSVGAQSYTLYTWFRDEEGNYVDQKPEGDPFYHEESGLWRNIRTHYFSVDMIIENSLIEYQIWSPEEIKKRILPWFESAKPFHAELLRFTVNPPDVELTMNPLYLGMATMRGGKHRIDLDRPTYDPAVIHAGVATMRGGWAKVGLARPERYDTPLYHGIATVQVYFMTVNPAPGEHHRGG